MSLLERMMRALMCIVRYPLRLLLRVLCDTPYQYKDTKPLLAAYDFIVVGGGAAGCVVATRLAETGATVLLLEAGDSAPPETLVPGLVGMLTANDDLMWGLKDTTRENETIFKDDVQKIPQGRVMGGSHSINGLKYVRGHKKDYDHWASLGNQGWDFVSVLPYFKKAENWQGPQNSVRAENMGKGGPLTLTPVTFYNKINEAFVAGGQELGFNAIEPNTCTETGFTGYDMTIKDGARVTTSEAYVRPNIHRENFYVRVNSFVTKILFDSDKKATGVEYTCNSEKVVALARKEVVISCGALQTPKLLMLSGVGPADHLNQMKIPVVSNIEGVGKNLQDHLMTCSLAFPVRPGAGLKPTDMVKPSTIWSYIKRRTGELSTEHSMVGQAYIGLGEQEDWPDVFLDILSFTLGTPGSMVLPRHLGLKEQDFKDLYTPTFGREGFTIHTGLGRPKSRGSVTLKSNDPKDIPNINFNYFDHPDDIELLTKGCKLAMKVAETSSMKRILGAEYVEPQLRGCEHLPPMSDAFWHAFLRRTVCCWAHYAGTCKMAPSSDPSGVVSPRLIVRGVQGLRVIDASVMPQVVVANTLATTIMIGEKGADLIKQDWGYPTE